mgnify:CR=1 FL=1
MKKYFLRLKPSLWSGKFKSSMGPLSGEFPKKRKGWSILLWNVNDPIGSKNPKPTTKFWQKRISYLILPEDNLLAATVFWKWNYWPDEPAKSEGIWLSFDITLSETNSTETIKSTEAICRTSFSKSNLDSKTSCFTQGKSAWTIRLHQRNRDLQPSPCTLPNIHEDFGLSSKWNFNSYKIKPGFWLDSSEV